MRGRLAWGRSHPCRSFCIPMACTPVSPPARPPVFLVENVLGFSTHHSVKGCHIAKMESEREGKISPSWKQKGRIKERLRSAIFSFMSEASGARACIHVHTILRHLCFYWKSGVCSIIEFRLCLKVAACLRPNLLRLVALSRGHQGTASTDLKAR